MPSLVDRSPSPAGSCIQKPVELTAVTIPRTPETALPSYGERCAVPWISSIVTGGMLVVIRHEKFAFIVSGGSFESRSCTAFAVIDVVQSSPAAKLASGSMVNVVVLVPGSTVPLCVPETEQVIVNQRLSRLTGSVNVTVRFVAGSTSDALFAGTVDATPGAASPTGRGLGAPTLKSAALLSVSVSPPPCRIAAVVLESVGVGAVSAQFAAPKPTRSTAVGQAPLSAVVDATSATLPAVADIAMLPVASGPGKSSVPPAPLPSWTR